MKVLYDYHMHSEISPDAHFPMEEMCDSAVKKGLKEIAFTDHYEFYVNGVTKPYFNEAYIEDYFLYALSAYFVILLSFYSYFTSFLY